MGDDELRCVKCGGSIARGALACRDCEWPLSLEAWPDFERRPLRVTIDTSCINAKRENAYLNRLEVWVQDDRLVLQRADAMLGELKGESRVTKAEAMPEHPELFTLGVSMLDGPDVLAGPDMAGELKEILFPTSAVLTPNQHYDVEHLRQHVRTGGDFFITLNKNDFITRGRQERLRAIGIWVMTPAELTDLLHRAFGWS